jgi:hypothetical protein
MVAADHPEVVEHYRAAHTIAGRRQDQTTEDQRRAFMHYRALFAALLDDGVAAMQPRRTSTSPHATAPTQSPVRTSVETDDPQGRRSRTSEPKSPSRSMTDSRSNAECAPSW